jgi:hypothetical protein
MMCARGGTYEEVNLEKDGEFGPRSIYRICMMKDIVNVVGSLKLKISIAIGRQ